MCHSFCPASETQVFSGSGIERAVAHNGKRYSDLSNAFAYRKHLVAGCTCNGKAPEGLAHVSPQNDPTLRPGDIVATGSGLMAYESGGRHREASFTPVDQARVSKSVREQLAQVKVRRPLPAATATRAAATTTGAAPEDSEQSMPSRAEVESLDTLRGELRAVQR
jgi:hypothetical protein